MAIMCVTQYILNEETKGGRLSLLSEIKVELRILHSHYHSIGETLEIIRGSKCIDLLATCTVHNKPTIFDQGLLMSVNCVHKPSSTLNCSINFRGQKSKRNNS